MFLRQERAPNPYKIIWTFMDLLISLLALGINIDKTVQTKLAKS